MKPLYVIDASNFNYKFEAVHSGHCSVNINGVNISTALPFGYIKALRHNPFDDILIVLDGLPSQSLAVLPTYKGTRVHEKDDAMKVSIKETMQMLTQLGKLIHKNIQVVCSPLQETDQVISSIVHRVLGILPPRWKFLSMLNTKEISQDPILKRYSEGVLTPLTDDFFSKFDTVIIASTDGDFLQLQRYPNVFIDKSVSGKEISNDITTKSVASVHPAASPAYKAIFGDVSDNVPPIYSFDKSEVLNALYFIDSDEILQEFLYSVRNLTPCRYPELYLLAESIHYLCLPGFERNFAITYLTYVSDPFILTFPSYDINTTLTKYKLKVK